MLLGMHFLVDVLAFFLPTAFSQPKTKQTLDILETPVLIRVALQVAKIRNDTVCTHDSSFSHSLLFSTKKSHPASLNTSSVKVPSLRPQLQAPQSDHLSKDTDTSPSQRQICTDSMQLSKRVC